MEYDAMTTRKISQHGAVTPEEIRFGNVNVNMSRQPDLPQLVLSFPHYNEA